jgi:AraC-like DNA-binding protein
VEISDCTFSGNTTLSEGETGSHGGAVWLSGGKASFASCSFKGNSSRWGGAVYSNGKGNGTFTNCTFGGTSDGQGNTASTGSGGAAAIDAGTLTFNSCTVTGNKAAKDRAGAFFVSGEGSLTVDGGVYSANSASKGGCIYVQGEAAAIVKNAEFKNNTSTTEGGVFQSRQTSTLTVTSCSIHDNSSISGDNYKKCSEILSYINQNLTEDLNMDMLSAHFALSGSYMSTLFKKETGTSLHKYISQQRISLAKRLLSEGLPVTEVYTSCGFGDYSNFLKVFKKTVGVSPKKFAQLSGITFSLPREKTSKQEPPHNLAE